MKDVGDVWLELRRGSGLVYRGMLSLSFSLSPYMIKAFSGEPLTGRTSVLIGRRKKGD